MVTLSDTVLQQLAHWDFPIIRLTHETPVPIKNLYKTPRTLGADRLAAVIGANAIQPNRDLLIIDDLGTELSNTFTNSMLYTCINERQLHGKSTVISTNLSLEQLRDRYSERIFSRITGNYTLWKLIGKDIRVLKRMEGSFS